MSAEGYVDRCIECGEEIVWAATEARWRCRRSGGHAAATKVPVQPAKDDDDSAAELAAVRQELEDTRSMLDTVRAQRDEANELLLDAKATVSMLRRKLNRQQTPTLRAEHTGYCDSTRLGGTGDVVHCALDAGHTTLHQDASLHYTWTDNDATADRCTAEYRGVYSGIQYRCHLPAGHDGQHRAEHVGTFSSHDDVEAGA
ncbi:hypothetical protein SEA_CLOWN_78 [Gordonia phage Clown]|uniref:Uncharacterized protein n=1 Tax=Gordonia phage Clown TaxID=2759393 RepID=A0A7L7SIG3_9CAUD|nr:hypothetical protein KNV25_gp78 [Gordonia phage Clown]QOC56076.1 hypothetical protein SEA_CLOWN_78 [Gordonia phage Clown]